MIKLFAPFLPYVTEVIYQELFAAREGLISLHLSHWPQTDPAWQNSEAEKDGEILIEVATAVRRYKSEAGLSLNSQPGQLYLLTADLALTRMLNAARPDLLSVTRANSLTVSAPEASRVEGSQLLGQGAVTIVLQK
jgi:valyl-tRNA synthetase